MGTRGLAPNGVDFSWPFMGWMDDVRFYTRGLTADEIRSIYGGAFCENGKQYISSNADCQAVTLCKRGEYEVQAPTATSDRSVEQGRAGRG